MAWILKASVFLAVLMQALYDFLCCPHEGSNIGIHFYMTAIAMHSLLALLNYMCLHTLTKFPAVY